MAPCAGAGLGKIVSAEGAPSVVTLQTVISRRSFVLKYGDVGYLTALRSTRDNAMTFAAVNALPRCVIGMTENSLEIILRGKRSTVRRYLVAYIAAADLALGCVTCVAIFVSVDAGRDRLSCTGRTMAKRTAL